jgi:preprotein translocase subunit YajC
MKQNKKKYCTTVALVWLGCAILLFFIYMIVLEPQRQNRKSVEEELAEKKLAYEEALKAKDEVILAKLAGDLDGLQSKLKNYVVDFADSANLTFAISEIADIQDINNFDIKSQDNRSSKGMGGFTYIGQNYFDVSLETDFNKFAMFLNSLERHDPTMLVDGFSITRSTNMAEGHKAKLNLAVLVKKNKIN